MKLNKDQLADARKIYDIYWHSYLHGNLDAYASTLDEDFEMIGTSESEVAHNKMEGIVFFKAQLEEVVGKADMRNRQISAKPVRDMVLINETCDIYVLGEPEWTFYSKVRLSTILHETDSGWKVIQQYGSLPAMRVQEGETIAIDKISRENIELRDAVKRRTAELENKNRELEIEAALERVRAKSMAMKTQSDLLGIIELFGEQLIAVGIKFALVAFMEGPITKTRDWDLWSYLPEVGTPTQKVLIPYIDHPYFLKTAKAVEEYQKTGEPIQVKIHTKEERHTFLPHFFKHSQILPDEVKEFLYANEGETIVDAFLGEITVSMTKHDTEPYTAEELAIFERFAKEFRQTYIRFLDIKKAEEQAREAQIEASLERVRAKAMSMQNSDELDEVLSVLCEQFDVLGILPMSTHMTVFNFDNNTFTFRETGKYGDRSFGEQTVDLDAMDTWKDTVDKWKADKATDVNKLHFPTDTLAQVWEVFHESFASMPEESRITPADYPDGIYHTAGKHPFGYIGMNQTRPASPEEEQIVIKFANEFGRAYQRFLDLQKAEDQAKEAQIEAALERVRAQTMAMHSSEDVGKCVVKMFAELTSLGVDEGTRFGIGILNHDNENNQLWTARKDGEEVNMHIGHLEMSWHPLLKSAREAWKAQVSFHKYILEGEDLINYYKMLNTAPDYKIQIPLEKLPKKEIQHCFIFEHGFFYAFTPHEFQPELIQITKRFSSLFEQTYRRYLDLVKAEDQAREAKIEAALEKVRSRSLAMHNSDELTEVVSVLFEKLKDLQVPFTAVGIATRIEGSKDLNAFVCGQNDEGLVITNYRLPYFDNILAKDFCNALEKQIDFFVGHYSKQEKDAFYEYLIENTAEFRHLPEDIKRMIFDSTSYTVTIIAVNNATFNINDFEGKVLADNEIEIIKRFARVFDQAYTRFLDLQKAEAQAREAQIEAALERVRS
ncbi:MAG: hypothetical protein EA341_03460, partial [Mongoliibacter sp.]|uniref:nuclear transport factor 2 family protein n=1 Tax=Mongoliibacter sp. TaxID=2022438 RepID=UPI0012F0CD45